MQDISTGYSKQIYLLVITDCKYIRVNEHKRNKAEKEEAEAGGGASVDEEVIS